MHDHAADRLHTIALRLHRNPVLTALTVTTLIIGVTASLAGVAAWRASSACYAQASTAPHLARDAGGGGDDSPALMRHQALQADLVMGVGQAAPGELTVSSKNAACPCSASTRWHWQRI